MDQDNVSRLSDLHASSSDREAESPFTRERSRRRAWLGLDKDGPLSSAPSGGNGAKR